MMRLKGVNLTLLLLLIIGGVPRLAHIGYRSFWADEAWFANVATGPFENIFIGSRGELGHPLQPGFALCIWLWAHITKASSETIFRIWPELFGIATILIAYYLVKMLWNKNAALLAAGCACGWELLVHFSRELNQYSGAIFFVFAMLMLAEKFRERPSVTKGAIFAIVSFLVISYSFQVSSIVFAAYLILGISFFFDPNLRKSGLVSYIVSALVFGLFGILSWFLMLKSQWTIGLDSGGWGWRPCFVSFSKLDALNELLKSAVGYLSLPYDGALLAFSLIGLFLWPKGARKKMLLYFVSVLIIALILSAFGLQPLCHRQILFLLPFLILGATGVLGFVIDRLKLKSAGPLAIVFALFLLAPNVEKYVFAPQKLKAEESREVIARLKEVCRKSDVLYVYYGGVYAFNYYGRGIKCKTYIGTNYRGEPNLYLEEIQPHIFEGERFFILFTHALQSEVDDILGYLGEFGDLELVSEDSGAAALVLIPDRSHNPDLKKSAPSQEGRGQPGTIWSYPKRGE